VFSSNGRAHNLDGSTGEEYWRERADQLQHALSSRISVEQAKGILGERLGLDMEGAFALLRYAARGERMKLHELAQAVVDNDETPEPVIRALARHASVLGGAPRADRVAQTELFFRAVNEEIAANDGHGTTRFLCECGNPSCKEGLELTAEALHHLHAENGLFVVLPGHEISDLETVVDRQNGYLVVRRTALED
jgi:ANTAR domain-containing protein